MFRRRFLSLGPFDDARRVLGVNLTFFAVAAFALAVIAMVAPHSARAELVVLWSEVDLDTDIRSHVLWDDENDILYYLEFDLNNGASTLIEIGNPSPDGQSTGLGPDQGSIQIGAEIAKKHGGNPVQETNPLNTPIGRGLVERGTVPGAEIDPWDRGAVLTEDIGFGGGGGGFDPNMPIGEQIGKMKQKGKSKDDEGGDGSDKNETFHDISDIAPEIVDPSPEPIRNDAKSVGGLWDVPAANHAVAPVKHSFVLMGSPAGSNVPRRGLGATNHPTIGVAKAGRGNARVGNARLGSVGTNSMVLGNAKSLSRGLHQGLTNTHSMGAIGVTPAIRSIGGAATSLSTRLH